MVDVPESPIMRVSPEFRELVKGLKDDLRKMFNKDLTDAEITKLITIQNQRKVDGVTVVKRNKKEPAIFSLHL